MSLVDHPSLPRNLPLNTGPAAGWSGSLASVEACNELKRGVRGRMDVTEVEGKRFWMGDVIRLGQWPVQ